MNSRVLAAIAAAILAFVGIGAVVMYAASAQTRAFGGATLVTVYRTTAEVNANSSSEDVQASIEEVRLPTSAVPEGAIRELSDIQGLKTTVPLIPGEVLVEGRFDKGGSAAASGSSVPKGLQEVTIALGVDAAGSVAAGHRVGIILSAEDSEGKPTSRMFAQSVLVTSVTGTEGKFVTFAANGKLATQIAAAAQGGAIRLTIQNDDSVKDGGESVKSQSLVK